MSPRKLNSLLTGTFFAIVIAIGGSVMAQDGLRLFKPYGPDTFGGRRSNEGVYGSVSGIYWHFSAPKGGYIGATTANGSEDSRRVHNGTIPFTQRNSLKINLVGSDESLGTRFEFGNRRGHHGWLVGGYGLPSQSYGLTDTNVSVVIRDTVGYNGWDDNLVSLPEGADLNVFIAQQQALGNIGYLWGTISGPGTVIPGTPGGEIEDPDNPGEMIPDPDNPGTPEIIVPGSDLGFAPLPIRFASIAVSANTSHRSGELMYTYRANPYTWGTMELLAGARYWDLADSFGLTATGGLTGTALTDMSVRAKVDNRVFGPQIGIKLARSNARWTFGAEGRFTAGINCQSAQTRGYITPDAATFFPVHQNTNFAHKQDKEYFTPIVELRASADFQMTNAVSLFGAFNAMCADNVGRGVRVTDYVVSDGRLFGIRGNDRNDNIVIYGFEVGLRVNR